MGHPENIMPFCVQAFSVTAATAAGTTTLAEVTDNHHGLRVIRLEKPVTTAKLAIRLVAPSADIPAALFSVRCFA